MKHDYEKSEKMFLDATSFEYSSVCWNVTSDEDEDREKAWVNVDLRIADCHKIASLDFGFAIPKRDEFNDGDSETCESRIRKLDSLIDSLCRFRSAILEANEIAKLHSYSPEGSAKRKAEVNELLR